MLTQEQSLVESIRQNPTDKLRREVYGDYLIENGREEFGNFIHFCHSPIVCTCGYEYPPACYLSEERKQRDRAIQTYLDTFGRDWAADAIPPLTHYMSGSKMITTQTREMLYTDMSGLSTCNFRIFTIDQWESMELNPPFNRLNGGVGNNFSVERDFDRMLNYNHISSGVAFSNGIPTHWRGRCLDWFDPKWGIGKQAVKSLPIQRVEFTDMVDGRVRSANTYGRYNQYQFNMRNLEPLQSLGWNGATFETTVWDYVRKLISELAIKWAKLPTPVEPQLSPSQASQ